MRCGRCSGVIRKGALYRVIRRWRGQAPLDGIQAGVKIRHTGFHRAHTDVARAGPFPELGEQARFHLPHFLAKAGFHLMHFASQAAHVRFYFRNVGLKSVNLRLQDIDSPLQRGEEL